MTRRMALVARLSILVIDTKASIRRISGKATVFMYDFVSLLPVLTQLLQTWANGDAYEGNWEDGRMHGKGRKTMVNGDVYDGVLPRKARSFDAHLHRASGLGR